MGLISGQGTTTSHATQHVQKKRIDTPLCSSAELFTIAKTWRQPKCPSTGEWIKMWYMCVCVCMNIFYTYNEILISHQKMPFTETWMDL